MKITITDDNGKEHNGFNFEKAINIENENMKAKSLLLRMYNGIIKENIVEEETEKAFCLYSPGLSMGFWIDKNNSRIIEVLQGERPTDLRSL